MHYLKQDAVETAGHYNEIWRAAIASVSTSSTNVTITNNGDTSGR